MRRKILITSLVATMLVLGAAQAAADVPWSLPDPIEYDGHVFDQIWMDTYSVEHPYFAGSQNLTAYAHLYEEKNGEEILAVIGLVVVEMGFAIFDFNLSSFDLSSQVPGFTGSNVWDLLLYFLDTSYPGTLVTDQVDWEHVTDGAILNVQGHQAGLAYYGEYLIGGILLENDGSWEALLNDSAALEAALGFYVYDLMSKFETLATFLESALGSTLGPYLASSAPSAAGSVPLAAQVTPPSFLGAIMGGTGQYFENFESQQADGDNGGGIGDILDFLGIPGYPPVFLAAVVVGTLAFAGFRLRKRVVA